MARILGDLVLPEWVIWKDQMHWSPVRRTTQRTTGGGIVVTHQKLIGGRPITLVFPQESFGFSYQEALKLMEMSSQAGSSFIFQWDTYVSAVVFEEQPHNLEAFINYYETEHDFYYGEIKLLSV